ncbi:MAG: hypothetical protein HKO79_00595 [Desulfobacterales bacterium]|nr:hypothetical protein [Deltaproteobacteria bacterium]NNL40970.1 hypothetical protein [Desulfobacterales bacterium]
MLKSLIVAIVVTLLTYWVGRKLLPDEPLLVIGGALFLGLMLWTSIEKLWGKQTDQTDSLNVFPLLDKKVLEKWGKKWGEQYDFLNKIVLYDVPLKYPLDVRYILYFEFDTSSSEGKKSEKIFNETLAFEDDTILASGFSKVYRRQPEKSFREDWFLSVTSYSGFNEEYSWVIYKKT